MELNDWIDKKGGLDAAAVLLGENPRTVRSWYRFDRVPLIENALNIVVRTKGEVDYNGIYGPIARTRVTRGEVSA